MAYQTIEVRKITPTIGAEIHGVDLSQPLGNQQFQEVHDALIFKRTYREGTKQDPRF